MSITRTSIGALEDLTDATITSVASGEVLKWNGSAWVNSTVAGAHDAVTVTDSAEIDFTLTGQDITASLKTSSIDETKLDASVNASLDLADSASQPGHTHTAANVTDFDTEVSNNTDVAANTTARHAAVTVTDSATINLTLAGQDVTASLTHLGIENLVDPNADRIMMWDDSAGFMRWMVPSTGLDLTPSNVLTVRAASLTQTGIAETATNAEVDAVTDLLRYVPPAYLLPVSSKTTPVDADLVTINDSAATNGRKRLSFTNLKAFLKTYFDTLYGSLANDHVPVTVADSAEIDMTLTGQQISASIIANSIDETKLDASVNASLDLADSALQSETSHADVLVDGDFASNGLMSRTGAGTYSIVTDNSANWNTAFGWGNHASAGYITATLTQEQVEDYAGAMVATGGTKTLITVTYQDATNDMDFVVDSDLSHYNNATSAFITAASLHDAVTVTDSAEIDFTLTGQNITASLIASSIDETKLDASVNASLDLADRTGNTGIISGGQLTINSGDNTKLDIAAGSGYIIDHTTTPSTVNVVTWSAFTAVTLTNLATSFATDIAINSSGAVVQQNTYTNEELRSLIFLGGVDHSNQTTINNTFELQVPSNGIGSSVYELSKAIGDINLTGNLFSANGANLNINKSSGQAFKYGSQNASSKNAPHITDQIAQSPVTFNYVFNNGSGGGSFTADTTSIDPANYDDGSGTLASVSGANFTIQRILMFVNSGSVFVQYGTETFSTKAAAVSGLNTISFVNVSGIRTAMVRGYLIVRANATDLSSSTQAEFVSADRFGGVGSRDAGGGTVSWGNITGTIADQTDLVNGALHDGFSDYVAAEHIDWTSTSSNLNTSGSVTAADLNISGTGAEVSTVITDITSGNIALFQSTGNAVTGVRVCLDRTRTGVVDDNLGSFDIRGRDDAGNEQVYARFVGGIVDPTDGSEDGSAAIVVASGSSLLNALALTHESASVPADMNALTYYENGHRLPSVLSSKYTSTGNVGTGTDTLESIAVDAAQLFNDGDALDYWAFGRTAASGSTSKTWTLSFGGTTIHTMNTTASGLVWEIHAHIMKDGTDSWRAIVRAIRTNSAGNTSNTATETTSVSLDLDVSQTLLLTGAATNNDDIVLTQSKLNFNPA